MPRIAAPTVAEHRARVQERLVDAAEQLMRAGQTVTPAAVSAAAGIARNSIYRYVENVDDLRSLVIARYLPAWLEASERELAAAQTSEEKVVAWVRVNLAQAANSGHGWLMESSRARPSAAVERAHRSMRDTLSNAWLELVGGDERRAAVAGSLTLGLLEGGFRQLNAGVDRDLVVEVAAAAADALVHSVVDGANALQR